MSADASAAEASEVLDLNADAAAVDGHELAKGTVADEIKPADGTGDAAGEGLNGGGRDLLEGSSSGALVEAGDTDVAAAVRLVTDEPSEVAGADVDGQDGESSLLVYSSSCQSTEPVIPENKAEAAVDHVDGSEGANIISLTVEDRTVEGSTNSGGAESYMEVDLVVQETSGASLGFPAGSEVGIVSSQTIDEKDDRRDTVAPDLYSSVVSVKSDESENVRPSLEYTVMAIETIGDKVHGAGSPASAAEISPFLISQVYDGRNCDCPTKVDASSELPGDSAPQMGEKLKHMNQKPPFGVDTSLINANLVDNFLSKHPNDKSVLTPTNGDVDTYQVSTPDDVLSNKGTKIEHPEGLLVTEDDLVDTESAIMSGCDLVAEEQLQVSSHLCQNSLDVFYIDPAQIDTVASQNIEVQHVGSGQAPPPRVEGVKNVFVTPSAGLGSKYESPETYINLSEQMSDRGINLNKKKDVRIVITSDVVENEVSGLDMVEDGKELNLEECVEKEDKFEKCSKVNPDATGVVNKQQASYHLPQPDKPSFSISDLVWGKVKSHPWWPGQILDPADASDMALKHQKKDNFLVGYFGDKTFAWCEESKLKPFVAYFSQLESQSSSDAFINAVSSALTEVSRRAELGMSCSCLPEGVISSLKQQKIENAGIREESSCPVVDKPSCTANFEPNNFLGYIKALALYPYGGMDKLGLVIGKSQMMAFSRLRSHNEFPVSTSEQRISENDAIFSRAQKKVSYKSFGEHPSPISTNEEMASDSSAGKRKKSQGDALHRQMHISEHGRKQKSLSELMNDKSHYDIANGDGIYFDVEASGESFAHLFGKKHKNDDFASSFSGKSKRKRLDALGDVEKKTPTSDRSFKVGECISRIASKLTGSPSIIKCNGESVKKDNSEKADEVNPEVFEVSLHTPEDTQRKRRGSPKNYSSPEEMLSQLCLAAKDPMKGYSFCSAIICFFSEVRELRDSGSMVDKRFEKIKKKRGRKRKSESHPDLNDKLLGAHSPSTSRRDEKSPEMIGRKRGRKKKSESKNDLRTDATETSTPDYMADSYWTDRIVCSSPEEKSQIRRRKRKGEFLIQSLTRKSKPLQESLTLSKMLEAAHHLRISAVSPTGNRDLAAEKQATFFGEKCLEESVSTALILSFNEPDALPSETNLIRIFSRFGPLKEAETEVLRETNSAKVVFKKHTDAELAFSSAGKYYFFGPDLVSYRLKNLPSSSMVSPEIKSDGREDRKIMDDDVLETPAQGEVNELVQKEVCEVAQNETKESAQEGSEEFNQEETNELVEGMVTDLADDNVKELCQEEAMRLAQEESEELVQAEMKRSTEEEAKEFTEDKLKDLAQDEVRELTQQVQAAVDGSTQEEIDKLVQVDMKDLTQDGVSECQEEVQELTCPQANEAAHQEIGESTREHSGLLVEDEMNDSSKDEVKELCQKQMKQLAQDEEKVMKLTQEESKESAQADMKESFEEEAKQLFEDEMTDLAQDEVKELTQEEADVAVQTEADGSTQEEETKQLFEDEISDLAQDEVMELSQEEPEVVVPAVIDGSTQEEVEELVQDEVECLTQDEVKKLCQEEGQELTHEEANESAQARREVSAREQVGFLIEDEMNNTSQDEVKELCQEEVNELAEDEEEAMRLTDDQSKEFTLEEMKESTEEETRELVEDEVKDLAQDEIKELTQEETKELLQTKVDGSAQEVADKLGQDEMTQDEMKECQEEVLELTHEEANKFAEAGTNASAGEQAGLLVEDEMQDSSKDEVMELCQEEAKELAEDEEEAVRLVPKEFAPEEMRESCEEETRELAEDEVKGLAQDEIKELTQEDFKELLQTKVDGSAQEDADKLGQGEMTQDETKECQEEVLELTHEEANKSAQARRDVSAGEQAGLLVEDEMKDSSTDEVKELCQEEAKELAEDEEVATRLTQDQSKEFTLEEMKKSTKEEIRELAEDEVKGLAQDERKELTPKETKELLQAKVDGSAQEDADKLGQGEMTQDEMKECQEEVLELTHEEANQSAQAGRDVSAGEQAGFFVEDEMKDSSKDEVMELCQEETKELAEDEEDVARLTEEQSKELASAEMKESTKDDTKELAEDEMKGLAHDELKALTREEAKELVQSEVDGSAQEEADKVVEGEMKDLTQDKVKECQDQVQEFTRPQANEAGQEEIEEYTREQSGLLVEDEMNYSSKDKVKELCQEEIKELAQNEKNALKLTQDKSKESAAEMEESTEEETKPSDEDEINDLAQDEVKELTQEDAKEVVQAELDVSTQEEAEELVQDEMQCLAQDEVTKLCQEEVQVLIHEEANKLAEAETEVSAREQAGLLVGEEMTDSSTDEVKELCQQEVKELVQDEEEAARLTQEESMELAPAEMKESTKEVTKDLAEDEMKGLAQYEMEVLTQEEAKELVQAELDGSTQEEAEELVQGEVKYLTQDDVKKLCQEEVQGLHSLTHGEPSESAQAEIEASTREQAGLSVQDEMNDSSKDEVKEFFQEEVKGLDQEIIAQEEVNKLCQEEVKKLAWEEVMELAQGDTKESTEVEAK